MSSLPPSSVIEALHGAHNGVPQGTDEEPVKFRAVKRRPVNAASRLLEANTAGASDKDFLGEIVTWDIHGKIIRVEELRDAMTKADINPDALHDLSLKNAFKRATKGLKKDRLIDELKTDGDIIKFQLTAKTVLEDMIEHDYECLINLDTTTGKVTCPEKPELAKEAADLLDVAADTRTSQDVSRLVQRLFECNADLFPINRRKGVAYFVPAEHVEFTAKIENFMEGCGGIVERYPVPRGSAKANAGVKRAVESGLEAMAEELESAIEEWDTSTRKCTKDRAQEKIELLLHKHQCYAHYLGQKQGESLAKLEELKLRIVDACGGDTEED